MNKIRMMKEAAALVVAFAISTLPAFAGGSLTNSAFAVQGGVQKITISWSCTTNSPEISAYQIPRYFRGTIQRAVFSQTGATGTTYAVSALDESGAAVLSGCSAIPTNGVTSTNQSALVNDLLTFSVSGVGTNASGSIVLYLK